MRALVGPAPHRSALQFKPDTDVALCNPLIQTVIEEGLTDAASIRATVLDALEPLATACLCGQNLAALGLAAGDAITVQSRRG